MAQKHLQAIGGFRLGVKVPSEKYSVFLDAVQDISGEGTDIYAFSTSYNEDHLTDRMALVAHLFEVTGNNFRKGWVVRPNPDYEIAGDEETPSLFLVEDITPSRREIDAAVERLQAFESFQEGNAGVSSTEGRHCKEMHCPEYGVCQRKEPGHVSFLPRIGKKKVVLESMGIQFIRDIPEEFNLTPPQAIVAESYKAGTVIDRNKIFDFLAGIQYPVSLFDVETFASPIPVLQGTRSNKRIVFQYSLHVDSGMGDPLNHFEFLAKGKEDPRIGFIESLLFSIPKTGSVVVYHQSFEKGVLEELADVFPQFSRELLALIPRMLDLEVPFAKRFYCDPGFHGSSSLKAVYPVLCPKGIQYQDLGIRNGEHASSVYLGYLHGILSQEEFAGQRADLLAYCGLDTLSMVGILNRLRDAVGEGGI